VINGKQIGWSLLLWIDLKLVSVVLRGYDTIILHNAAGGTESEAEAVRWNVFR